MSEQGRVRFPAARIAAYARAHPDASNENIAAHIGCGPQTVLRAIRSEFTAQERRARAHRLHARYGVVGGQLSKRPPTRKTFTLSPEAWALVEQLAERTGQSTSAVVEQAIRKLAEQAPPDA